jgi:hypothetical protein
VVNACFEDKDLTLQTTCYADTKQRSTTPHSIPCKLNIIILGPHKLFDNVGSFFEEHNLYLQDPVGCSQNVLYRNPHRLSAESGVDVWTYDLGKEYTDSINIEITEVRPESVDILNSQEDWAETQQPGSIRTSMKRWGNESYPLSNTLFIVCVLRSNYFSLK